MPATNPLNTPVTLGMKVFTNNHGQITQAMIDIINQSPTLVRQLNIYNNDVITGYRTDSDTGQAYPNYKVTALTFDQTDSTSAAYGGAPSVAPNTVGIDFRSTASFFTSGSAGIGSFVGYLAHEIGHYVNGVSDFNNDQNLLGQLN